MQSLCTYLSTIFPQHPQGQTTFSECSLGEERWQSRGHGRQDREEESNSIPDEGSSSESSDHGRDPKHRPKKNKKVKREKKDKDRSSKHEKDKSQHKKRPGSPSESSNPPRGSSPPASSPTPSESRDRGLVFCYLFALTLCFADAARPRYVDKAPNDLRVADQYRQDKRRSNQIFIMRMLNIRSKFRLLVFLNGRVLNVCSEIGQS
jgi:hypothetical protein